MNCYSLTKPRHGNSGNCGALWFALQSLIFSRTQLKPVCRQERQALHLVRVIVLSLISLNTEQEREADLVVIIVHCSRRNCGTKRCSCPDVGLRLGEVPQKIGQIQKGSTAGPGVRVAKVQFSANISLSCREISLGISMHAAFAS